MGQALTWLQDWYLTQCDGDWEHEFGIEIKTLDNPGWQIEVDLAGTLLDGVAFVRASVELSEHDWYSCEVVDRKFRASCGARNLAEVLEVFRKWAGEMGYERRKAQRLGSS